MNTLAERLQFAMTRKNLSQADLARSTGAARASVTNWVNGRTKNLKGKNLVRAAAALDVTTEWLAYGVGEIDTDWPFSSFSLVDLNNLSQEVLEDISDYVMMKIHKNKNQQGNNAA